MGLRYGIAVLPAALLLAACSPNPARTFIDGVEVRTVRLTMVDEVRFEPDRVEVQQGETVRFFVVDETGFAHEAFIGTAREQADHAGIHAVMTAEEQAQTTHFGYGIHIAANGSGEFVYHFGDAGTFYIGCHYPGHYEAGMRVTIEVTPTTAN